jgi:HEAT repeats
MRFGAYATILAVIATVSGCFQREAPRQDGQANAATRSAARDSAAARGGAIQEAADPPVSELSETLRHEEDPRVRREAVYLMADAVEAEDAAVIGEALSDPDPEVRVAAIEALTGFEGTASADWLSIGVGDPDPRVRRTAVEALGEIGGESARLLLEQARGDADPDVREAAAQMLSEPQFTRDGVNRGYRGG